MKRIITTQEALDIEKAILFAILGLVPIDLDKNTLCVMTRKIFLDWCEAEGVAAIDVLTGIERRVKDE